MALKGKHIAIFGTIAVALGVIAAFLLPKNKNIGQPSAKASAPSPISSSSSSKSSSQPSSSSTSSSGNTPISNELTYTPLTSGQALIIANNLLDAMDRYGTKEQVIIENFSQVHSQQDLLLVIEKFGTHKYFAVGTIFGLGNERNLMEWLKADLNENELIAIRQNVFDKYNVPL